MWPFKSYKLGQLKKLETISIDEFKEHPVWVCDLSGESKKGYDETSIRPILEDVNITSGLERKFVSVEFLIKIVDKDIWGTASYLNKKQITSIGLWLDKSWKTIHEANLLEEDVIIEVVPEIHGKKGVKYMYNPKTVKAEKI